MSSRSNVGGVFSVEMWLAKGSGRGDPPTSLDGDIEVVRVPIISTQSQYSEVETISGGVSKVEHTLTLVTLAKDEFWGVGSLREATRVGVVAEVFLPSRGKILLGWSTNLGYEQPLRLTKSTLKSGDSVNESSTKTWVFKSYSTKRTDKI